VDDDRSQVVEDETAGRTRRMRTSDSGSGSSYWIGGCR
jgi:hypothetical protein